MSYEDIGEMNEILTWNIDLGKIDSIKSLSMAYYSSKVRLFLINFDERA